MRLSVASSTASSRSFSTALRPFQAEIVALARESNIVMVGGTGIGKTYVAIELLSEQDYSNGQRAFFMAPTRQLVWQITAKIQKQSTLNAKAFVGDAMRLWSRRDWERELAVTRVFVCTPEVLRNALEQGYVRMDRINLLVFDECHHVSKRHPYAQVIKAYDASNCSDMPRIFGTTACPTRNCAENLHAVLHKEELAPNESATYSATALIVLEKYDRMDDSQARQELEQLPVVAAIVNSNVVTQDKNAAEENDAALMEEWRAHQLRGSTLEVLLTVLQETKAVSVLSKLLRQDSSQAAHDEERRRKYVKQFVTACTDVFSKWGLWCVLQMIELEIERAAINASQLLTTPGSMYGYDKAAITTIIMARQLRTGCNFAATKRLHKIVALLNDRLQDNSGTLKTDEVEEHDDQDEDHLHSGDESTEEKEDTGNLVVRLENLIVNNSAAVDVTPTTDETSTTADRLQNILFVTHRV